jgi:hypothetical protein
VLSLLEQMRGGRLNDPRFHSRKKGEGPFAALLRKRFERACRAAGLNRSSHVLETSAFRRPPRGGQLALDI